MSENTGDYAISVRNLNKKFKVYENVFVDRLKEKFFFWNAEKYYSKFDALKDINLTLKKGEVVGLIGPNGAGKTTLLKILAGISYPTSGEIDIKGSMVAVLALGLGFNPRFTGRENIEIGGCLLGMSREEIKEKEEWIIEFSELGAFIDQPIRSYSSGMRARLSFAVASSVSPDILIIDEALATGDAFFVHKSLGRIHDICQSGTTAIFVSHNLMQIQRLCSERVILMDKGTIVNDAPAMDVIHQYNHLLYKHLEEESIKRRSPVVSSQLESKDYGGNGDVVITEVYFTDEKGEGRSTYRIGEKLSIHFRYEAKVERKGLKMFMYMRNRQGISAFGFQSDSYFCAESKEMRSRNIDFPKGTGELVMSFDHVLITANKYVVSVNLVDPSQLTAHDSDFMTTTVFTKDYLADLIIHKDMDMGTESIIEHPIVFEVVPD
ncbi:MAG: ABC transporter ATP-binding protein [Planctomycetes bacterium]|nr:ABC transporter ATP-binding protein [Planctomycetota bacterium]